MPDPKLQLAMHEVKAVLYKHDVAAVVLLASQSHIEHLLKPDCTWTCAKLEDSPDGRRLNVHSHHSEFPDKAAQKKCVENTVGMFAGFQTVLGKVLENMNAMLHVLGRHITIEHIDVNEGAYGAVADVCCVCTERIYPSDKVLATRNGIAHERCL